jgi:hypothetical protein
LDWVLRADVRGKLSVALLFVEELYFSQGVAHGRPEGLNSHAHCEQAQPMKRFLCTHTISGWFAKGWRLGRAIIRHHCATDGL